MCKAELRCDECGEIRGHKKNCSKQVYEICEYCKEKVLKENYKNHRATCVKRKDNFSKGKRRKNNK